MAKQLRIQLSESGSLRIDLSMPAHCAGRLTDMIPPQWVPAASAAHVGLTALSRAMEANRFEPCELFTLTSGEKSVRAWLE